ncbi:regulatory protein, gntR family [Nonomuraea maritima]|uniref:Regulatory protein, gntR family n=1 Tax=Nonomuraea maritima TaxID=683260 RepID=A0A1G8SJE1_9ACTN|nr:GntR family transcriptional regulator [Nonomuraea maritima]SDJ29284.1 regulatory protein, gntR family [Nonomuraea maritima]
MAEERASLTGGRVYTQLADRLRERITSGVYAVGDVLPSEAALCQEFRIARNTARRGLAILEDEGLIVTAPSKGRIVTTASAPSSDAPYNYQRIAGELRERIRSGELAGGAVLPSELMLRQRFAASRNTVRQALALLEREGLVVAEQGRGRFVKGETS